MWRKYSHSVKGKYSESKFRRRWAKWKSNTYPLGDIQHKISALKMNSKGFLHSWVPCLKLPFICWNIDWHPFSKAGRTMLWKASRYAVWIGIWRESAVARPMASVIFCKIEMNVYRKGLTWLNFYNHEKNN